MDEAHACDGRNQHRADKVAACSALHLNRSGRRCNPLACAIPTASLVSLSGNDITKQKTRKDGRRQLYCRRGRSGNGTSKAGVPGPPLLTAGRNPGAPQRARF
jgi:hypothetical protein